MLARQPFPPRCSSARARPSARFRPPSSSHLHTRRILVSNPVKFTIAIVCIAVCFCVASQVRADELQSIPPDQLTMTSEPKAPGAPAIYLYRQVDRDDGHAPNEFNFVRLKVL